MILVPQHINNLQPYKPGKSSDSSHYSRYKAILSSNENNHGPSPKAMKVIVDHVDQLYLYPDPQSEKLTKRLAAKHGRPISNLILSNGLDGLLYTMFKAFTVKDDHVITNDNSFVAFNKFAKMNDCNLEIIPNVDYCFDLSKMQEAINANTKIIYICNPNNPTGYHVPKDNIVKFLNHIPKHVLVVIDEAYFEFAYHYDATFPDSSTLGFDNVLTLRTFSKNYGLAGIRIGYGIANEHIINALTKVKLVFNPNSLAQAAAEAALDDDEHLKQTLDNNTRWLKRLPVLFSNKGIKTLPSHGNFICAIFESEGVAKKFFDFMDENGVLLRQLSSFGLSEGVRISIGTNEEMQYFSDVLERF